MLSNPGALIQHLSTMVIPLVFAISLHEAAHGWAAAKLGDTTALLLGRVTVNPLKHIDPFGTVLLPLAMAIFGGLIFGYAKPVPVSWQQLRRPRRDMALVALAGPLANLFMATIWMILFKTLILLNVTSHLAENVVAFTLKNAQFGVQINVILMLLNLLPIPPLDGSRVVSALLPPAAAIRYEYLEPFGLWILLACLFLGVLFPILNPLMNMTIDLLYNLF